MIAMEAHQLRRAPVELVLDLGKVTIHYFLTNYSFRPATPRRLLMPNKSPCLGNRTPKLLSNSSVISKRKRTSPIRTVRAINSSYQ